jgi:RimJ/RimL family protein N-acetyltransferase
MMQLVAYLPGQTAELPAARGWPHPDTATGLGFAANGAWTWLIVDDEGRVAGECGVKGLPGTDGTVEIGYGLAGPSRGRGLGRRAVAALVAELATRPGVRRIEARVEAGNTASRRVLEHAGFAVDEVSGSEVVYLRLV